jgi:hypothetical protein
MDFGCYSYIKKDCHSSLLRQEMSITKGKWHVKPEKIIPKGASYVGLVHSGCCARCVTNLGSSTAAQVPE